MKKIFLLGSERSGSNLLRTLLGNHSQISAPIAPHLCDVFNSRIKLYLPYDNKNLKNLYTDIEKYLNHEFNDWNIKFDINDIIARYNPKSFLDVYNSIWSENARIENKTSYFSKDNHLHNYALGLKMNFPDAYFIHLYRDPRDQVASWMRMPIFLHTPFQAINKWISDQNQCFKLIDFYGLNVFSIKYEELVDNPEQVMSATLNYLNLSIESSCFQTRSDNKEAFKNPLWKNINKPIISKNYQTYDDVLKNKDLCMIESLSGHIMNRLGYKRETMEQWKPSSFFKYSEKIKTKISTVKNKKSVYSEMKIFKDKQLFVNQIFKARSK